MGREKEEIQMLRNKNKDKCSLRYIQNKGKENISLEIQRENNVLEMICWKNQKKMIKKFWHSLKA